MMNEQNQSLSEIKVIEELFPMEKEVIFTDSLLQNLNKPGLWFVCSMRPTTALKQYVYDLTVELGLPIMVYSGMSKKEIQNAVIDKIKTKCIENAENENEREWLEQEMTEYNTHGFFWYPEELNEFVPNGSFWTDYVFFDEFKILSFTNSFSNLYLIDNLSELCHDFGSDYSLALTSIEQEAVEYKKTIIVFVSPNDSYYVSKLAARGVRRSTRY